MSFHIRKDFCAHVFENYFNVRRFYMSETLLNGIKSREKIMMHIKKDLCISFILDLSIKAKSYHLTALLDRVFTQFCFHLWRHAICFDAVLEVQRG